MIHERNHPNETFTVKVNKETILAAGGVHTPQLLELSGIGPKAILAAAGIEQKVDLPGVGENFQDHPQTKFVCNCMPPCVPGTSMCADYDQLQMTFGRIQRPSLQMPLSKLKLSPNTTPIKQAHSLSPLQMAGPS